ncbi:hypothetical protein NM688_g65 [Phlebia brevispora]|uniref:Uncharacterized protein n=1 Tax=Phlebia brevispora TaxID=194682 RepID=A0ACC1TFH6_9APHY|nr:hypothetical protein NM688_g65 [Phlebia brevispora]
MKLSTLLQLTSVPSTLTVLAHAAVVRPKTSSLRPVVNLTLDNFYETATDGVWLINYRNSDPECTSCTEAGNGTLWDDIAREITKEADYIHVGQVDCALDAEFRLCNKERVAYWAPQMRMYSGGNQRSMILDPTTIHYLGYNLLKEDPALHNTTEPTHSTTNGAARPACNLTAATQNATAETAAFFQQLSAELTYSMWFLTVRHLTAETFNQSIAEGLWFIDYYSTNDFLSYTRDFMPDWFKLGEEVRKHKLGVKVAQVNCAISKDLCDTNGVDVYPQIRLYRDGQFVETFEQPRDLKNMRSYLEDYARPYMEAQQTTLGGVEDVNSELTFAFNFTLAGLGL